MKVDEMVVYKYLLFEQAADDTIIALPRDAQFLKIGVQNDSIYLWALVDGTMPTERFQFMLKGTGHWAGDIIGNGFYFVDTVFMGPYVWHVWSRRLPSE